MRPPDATGQCILFNDTGLPGFSGKRESTLNKLEAISSL